MLNCEVPAEMFYSGWRVDDLFNSEVSAELILLAKKEGSREADLAPLLWSSLAELILSAKKEVAERTLLTLFGVPWPS